MSALRWAGRIVATIALLVVGPAAVVLVAAGAASLVVVLLAVALGSWVLWPELSRTHAVGVVVGATVLAGIAGLIGFSAAYSRRHEPRPLRRGRRQLRGRLEHPRSSRVSRRGCGRVHQPAPRALGLAAVGAARVRRARGLGGAVPARRDLPDLAVRDRGTAGVLPARSGRRRSQRADGSAARARPIAPRLRPDRRRGHGRARLDVPRVGGRAPTRRPRPWSTTRPSRPSSRRGRA